MSHINNEYLNFLLKKQKKHIASGFDISEAALNKNLFPFQKFIVQRAIKAGKYAVFADCGLGKSLMQLECAFQVSRFTNMPSLILAPLAVVGQTVKEGVKFGIPCRRYDGSNYPVQITNYEQLENIDTANFACIVLDESSILKNFEGKTKNEILAAFKDTPYKFCFTATPSPNDPMELGNHAEFLDISTRNEVLAMYFVHDSLESAKWRIKGHAVKLFYQFVGSWAVMLSKPHDIGFDTEGYELPPLNIVEEQIVTAARDNGSLFNDVAVSATDFNKELRMTREQRLNRAVELVKAKPNEPFIIWIKQNEEGEFLRKLLPDAIEVKGSDTPQYKEKHLLGFANNEFRILITKPEIASFGLNYQNCRNQVCASLDFSFERLYQCIRRSYRFGQTEQVNIHIITTDTMTNVIASINSKQEKFKVMQNEMSDAINVVLRNEAALNMPTVQEFKSDKCHLLCGDSFELINQIADESIDTMIFSPPFSSLYTYSNSVNDLSNCLNHDEFYQHFEFMIPQLNRVLKSGRHIGIHLTQLTTGIAKDGHYSIIDFRGEIIRLFQKHDFLFHGEVTIFKSPELAAIRTKNHQLMHGTTKKDSAIVRPGLADYLVIMRKKGVNQEPINHDKKGIPFEKWCKIASPVWMDIRESDTLQGWQKARENDDERHITPTQLSVIENYLTMYSNPNDTVFTPFMGIGSEVYKAVQMGRKAKGIELKQSYFDLAVQNAKAIEDKQRQVSLF